MQDRDDIYDYIEPENPLAALTLDDLFSEKAAQLTGHPECGQPGRAPGAGCSPQLYVGLRRCGDAGADTECSAHSSPVAALTGIRRCSSSLHGDLT
ncbi:type II toxin-antitoxin system RelE/ParE family toxin [Halomonas sp. DN3]|uniref:type II toxin-antitoxin system RelE/ParE family toxin n=1 Tax=Halomonas sp. DN3 TaxID=2953657 RepID=UPI00209D8AB3|nr:type II toxin-antitoxin system RelE/ParE family toxin [Halomonas sp. DN3]USZ52030.1 type II toxin-antitoxin system RelE/ParE family toxin [Halomonas sp. DN3]